MINIQLPFPVADPPIRRHAGLRRWLAEAPAGRMAQAVFIAACFAIFLLLALLLLTEPAAALV